MGEKKRDLAIEPDITWRGFFGTMILVALVVGSIELLKSPPDEKESGSPGGSLGEFSVRIAGQALAGWGDRVDHLNRPLRPHSRQCSIEVTGPAKYEGPKRVKLNNQGRFFLQLKTPGTYELVLKPRPRAEEGAGCACIEDADRRYWSELYGLDQAGPLDSPQAPPDFVSEQAGIARLTIEDHMNGATVGIRLVSGDPSYRDLDVADEYMFGDAWPRWQVPHSDLVDYSR